MSKFKKIIAVIVCVVCIFATLCISVSADTVVGNDSFIYGVLNNQFGYIPFGKTINNTPAYGNITTYFSQNHVKSYFRFRGSEIYVTAGTVIEFDFSMLESSGGGYVFTVTQLGTIQPISKIRMDTEYFVRYGGRFTATTSGYYTFQYYSPTGYLNLFSAQIYFDNSPVILSSIDNAVNQIVGNQNANTQSIQANQNANAQSIQANQNANTQQQMQNDTANTDKIIDNQNQLQENEKNEAESSGQGSVDDVSRAIEDKSAGFISAISNLVGSMSYNGTACAWSFPAIKLPAIEGVMAETQLTEEMPIDFEFWVNKIPSNILLLIRSILTIALIGYCFKELYGTISYVLTLKGGGNNE